MSENYQDEQWVWTEADFEAMGWHDCRIHALAFLPQEFEMVFDIDYISEWIHPQAGEPSQDNPVESSFQFWVAPATLVFENVYEVELEVGSYLGGLEMESIRREDPRPPRNALIIGKAIEWLWVVDCQQGEIRFRSAGYRQYRRCAPVLSHSQTLEQPSRGFSFLRGKIGEATSP